MSADGTEIFVADSGNNEVRRIGFTGTDPTDAASWTVMTIAGSTTAGFADGPGNTATLNTPYGMCFGPGNELFVAEETGNRIRRIDYTGGNRSLAASWDVTTIAGDNSQTNGASGLVNGQGTNARFNAPRAMAIDPAGNMYVADSLNNVIRKIDRGYNVTTDAGPALQGTSKAPVSAPSSMSQQASRWIQPDMFMWRISPTR